MRRRSAVPAVVVLFFLVFSPTINQVLLDQPTARALCQAIGGLFAVVFLLRYRLTRHGNVFIGLAIAAAATLVLIDPFVGQDIITLRKLVGVAIVAFLIPAVADEHPTALNRFLAVTLAANLLVVFFQLTGNLDVAYRHITYENEGASPVNLVALSTFLGEPIPVGYLPQLRPSGAFPSPTYLSLTLILLWYAVATSPTYRGRLAIMGVGVLSILSGSSVGLFLVGLSGVFLLSKGRVFYMLAGAALTLWAYAVLIPWQFAYNFNIPEFIVGFTSRLDVQAGGESIIQQRPYEFAAGLTVAVLAIVFARRLPWLALARAAIAIFFPVVLHDVGSSLLYWMLVALAVRPHTSIRFVAPVRREPLQPETTLEARPSPE
jgi:hypothetical protein